MKEKLKRINLSTIVNIVKAGLIGVIVSILLVLLFAFILKFINLNSNIISIIDQIIKILSVLISVVILSKAESGGLIINGLLVGAVYSILTTIVFSTLNGGINLSVAIFSDIAFSALIGGISAILINIFTKK